MKQSFEMPTMTQTAFIDSLSYHATEVVMRSPSSALYAAAVFRRAAEVETLLITKTGEVRGVATAWMDDMQPLIGELYLDGARGVIRRDYTPTVLEGIYGRTRIVSIDEIVGPLITLDLAARDTAMSLE